MHPYRSAKLSLRSLRPSLRFVIPLAGALVHDFNVYRWAGRMLLDATCLRRREKLARRIGRVTREG